MDNKIRLSHLARMANVSISTVSRIVTGSARVSPDIEKRVRTVAERCGVDLYGRRKSQIVAFILSNRERLHPFHSRVLAGAELYCAEHDYNVLFVSFSYSLTSDCRHIDLPRICERRQVACGFIVGGTNSQALLEALYHKELRFSVLGNNVLGDWRQDDYDVVWGDDIGGCYDMTRYLQSLGHQAIWFVGNCRLPWFARCYRGYHKAMLRNSLVSRREDVGLNEAEEVGYVGTKSILYRREPVTAILAGDSASALGACRALKDSGLRIPDDVSVAGVGEPENMMLEPPLTTVREFPEHAGRELAKLLLNRISKPDLAPQQVVIPNEIVRRESCSHHSVLRASDLGLESSSADDPLAGASAP